MNGYTMTHIWCDLFPSIEYDQCFRVNNHIFGCINFEPKDGYDPCNGCDHLNDEGMCELCEPCKRYIKDHFKPTKIKGE